jgi:hypothetical protein
MGGIKYDDKGEAFLVLDLEWCASEKELMAVVLSANQPDMTSASVELARAPTTANALASPGEPDWARLERLL